MSVEHLTVAVRGEAMSSIPGTRDVTTVIGALTGRDRALIQASQGRPMEPSDQVGALLDAVRALAGADIAHALIGGLAVGIHARVPRATMDVDLAVSSGLRRDRVAEVLQAAGFDLTGEYTHSLNFRSVDGEPVQVAFDREFDAAIERAEAVAVGDVTVAVVSKADLIAMKQRAADDPARRPSKALRDRADIELLREGVADDDEGW